MSFDRTIHSTMESSTTFLPILPICVLVILLYGDLAMADSSVSFYFNNKCPFPIWPATAPNSGHPSIAGGGFSLPSGQTRRVHAPPSWNGRVWARTNCTFNSHKPACETGDCDGRLACDGLIGSPPATLIEFTLQADKGKPNFYDVSLVDGYNVPVAVASKPGSPECAIRGCARDLRDGCPAELAVVNGGGTVVACKSACLAFDLDVFCCRNEFGSFKKCKPSLYSSLFKEACPNYYSYGFDRTEPMVNCGSSEYVLTFCPSGRGQRDEVQFSQHQTDSKLTDII